MATFTISNKANEFRVELIGRFAGGCVDELRTAWQEALRNAFGQPFTIDLTRISGCDADGRKLLREMHQHGTQFAAGTPEALVFLREISTSVRRGPTLVQEVTTPRKESASKATVQGRSKAAGE